jgi:hypothetical protein
MFAPAVIQLLMLHCPTARAHCNAAAVDGLRTILILFLLETCRRNWYQNRKKSEHFTMNPKIPFLPPLFPNGKSS